MMSTKSENRRTRQPLSPKSDQSDAFSTSQHAEEEKPHRRATKQKDSVTDGENLQTELGSNALSGISLLLERLKKFSVTSAEGGESLANSMIEDESVDLSGAALNAESLAVLGQFIDVLDETQPHLANELDNALRSIMATNGGDSRAARQVKIATLSELSDLLKAATEHEGAADLPNTGQDHLKSFSSSDLDPEAAAILGQFIDAVAASPLSPRPTSAAGQQIESSNDEEDADEISRPSAEEHQVMQLASLSSDDGLPPAVKAFVKRKKEAERLARLQRKDPPSGLSSQSEDSGPKASDPPLFISVSDEEVFCEPEPNPLHQESPRNCDHPDPELHSITIIDLAGELSVKSGGVMSPSSIASEPASPVGKEMTIEAGFDPFVRTNEGAGLVVDEATSLQTEELGDILSRQSVKSRAAFFDTLRSPKPEVSPRKGSKSKSILQPSRRPKAQSRTRPAKPTPESSSSHSSVSVSSKSPRRPKPVPETSSQSDFSTCPNPKAISRTTSQPNPPQSPRASNPLSVLPSPSPSKPAALFKSNAVMDCMPNVTVLDHADAGGDTEVEIKKDDTLITAELDSIATSQEAERHGMNTEGHTKSSVRSSDEQSETAGSHIGDETNSLVEISTNNEEALDNDELATSSGALSTNAGTEAESVPCNNGQNEVGYSSNSPIRAVNRGANGVDSQEMEAVKLPVATPKAATSVRDSDSTNTGKDSVLTKSRDPDAGSSREPVIDTAGELNPEKDKNRIDSLAKSLVPSPDKSSKPWKDAALNNKLDPDEEQNGVGGGVEGEMEAIECELMDAAASQHRSLGGVEIDTSTPLQQAELGTIHSPIVAEFAEPNPSFWLQNWNLISTAAFVNATGQTLDTTEVIVIASSSEGDSDNPSDEEGGSTVGDAEPVDRIDEDTLGFDSSHTDNGPSLDMTETNTLGTGTYESATSGDILSSETSGCVSSEGEEKKEERHTELMVEASPKTVERLLQTLVNGELEDLEKNKERVAALVSLAFPYFDKKRPSVVERARLQVKARRNGIPDDLTNVFLDAALSVSSKEKDLCIKVPKLVEGMSHSQDRNLRVEAFLLRMLAVRDAELRKDVLIFGTANSRGEAVEVDLNGAFQYEDYEGSDFSGSGLEWYESAAKLSRNIAKTRSDLESKGCDASVERLEATGENQSRRRKKRSQMKAMKALQKPKLPYVARSLPSSGTMSWNGTNDPSLTQRSSFSSVASRTYTLESDAEVFAHRNEMASWPTHGKSWLTGNKSKLLGKLMGEPEPINAVAACEHFERPSFMIRRHRRPGTQQWKQPYEPRTEAHPGYFSVDIHSLYNASGIVTQGHPLDSLPWEHREVKQRFLHEQSISYRRNWFGTTRKVYGNDRLVQPVCRPQSMEMPMTAGEWTEEWYKMPWDILSPSASIDSELEEIKEMRRKYVGDDDDDYDSWEETPECGTLKNVRLKIGERVTRVTPDLTSSLRRSRWRKKYFPKGTFPY